MKGEESVDGAIREAKEEVGIVLEPSQGKKLFSKIRDVIDGQSFQDIMDVWLFEYDGETQLENATTDEVADCKWMSVDNTKKLYDSGKLVYTSDYFFCALNDDIPDYSNVIMKLCELTLKYGVDLLFGYLERDEDKLYSSCMIIGEGKVTHNYRRISKGGKEYSTTDEHYVRAKHVRIVETMNVTEQSILQFS